MRNPLVVVMGTLIVVGVSHSTLADTLPPGATPISGSASFIRAGDNADVFLPIDVPEGQQFVLTDISIPLVGAKLTQVFGQEDLTTPRYEARPLGSGSSSSQYRDTFQTGLVFTSAPLIRVLGCYSPLSCFNFETNRVSFSGYLKPAP